MANKWKKVSEDRYIEMLECLWPACWEGVGFLVGEAWDHDAKGRPRFAAYAKIDGEHYEGATPMAIADFKALSRADVLSNVEA